MRHDGTKPARWEFAVRMEGLRAGEQDGEWKAVRRGWCLGGKEFRKELLAGMHERTGPNHGGEVRLETEEASAEQVLAEELKRRHWTAQDLAQRRKSDPHKVKIAGRLRGETTMTLHWIARELKMGAAGSLANPLRDAKGK